MKTRIAAVVTVALSLLIVLSIVGIGSAEPTTNQQQSKPAFPAGCGKAWEVRHLRPIAAKVWDTKRWERGKPGSSGVTAYRTALKCSKSSSHKAAMKRTWHRLKAKYAKHRKLMLYKRTVEPYYGCTVGGCDWWAIPPWSVNCESGGGVHSSNLYGNTQTYVSGMSKWEQSLAAYHLMNEYGGGYSAYVKVFLAWESGCAGYPG